MLDHVSIRVADFKKSAEFYERALGAIGYKRLAGDSAGSAGFVPGDSADAAGSVWISQASKDKPLTHNAHVAFRLADVADVKKFYNAAIAAGGRDNGAPGKCPEYSEDYYGGFVLDPDGNNIEATTYLKS